MGHWGRELHFFFFHPEQKRVNTEDLRGYYLVRLAQWCLGSWCRPDPGQQLSTPGLPVPPLCKQRASCSALALPLGSGTVGPARQRVPV